MNSAWAHNGAERGSSLTEILLVLAVVALTASLAFPSLRSLSGAGEAGAAARELLMCLRAARWKAVVSGCRTRLRTTVDGGDGSLRYFVERERGGRWHSEGQGGRLPGGVSLTATGPAVKVFNPNGTSSLGSLVLVGSGGERYRLSLNPATGRVRLWKGEKEVGVAE